MEASSSSTNRWTSIRIELLSFLGFWLLKLISFTLRWERDPAVDRAWEGLGRNPVIVIFWHDRQLMLFQVYQRFREKLVALASQHSDGRIIARILERIGFRTVGGSSSRGGAVALHRLVGVVRDGWDVAITPDGPKGPRYELKEGPLKLAQVTGAPIVPICYAVERCWRFRSWDRIFLPKPFSRAVTKIGTPLTIDRDASEEQFQAFKARVIQELQAVTEGCDRHEFC